MKFDPTKWLPADHRNYLGADGCFYRSKAQFRLLNDQFRFVVGPFTEEYLAYKDQLYHERFPSPRDQLDGGGRKIYEI